MDSDFQSRLYWGLCALTLFLLQEQAADSFFRASVSARLPMGFDFRSHLYRGGGGATLGHPVRKLDCFTIRLASFLAGYRRLPAAHSPVLATTPGAPTLEFVKLKVMISDRVLQSRAESAAFARYN